MADGITVTGTIELERTMGALFDLPEKDRKAILRAVGKEAAPELLGEHYRKNRSAWAPPSEKYARTASKRGKDQLVRTGAMLNAMTAKKAPTSVRKVTVTKVKKARDTYRVTISVRKMVNGKNVWTFAQRGVAKNATVRTKFGRTKDVQLRDLKKGKFTKVEVNRDRRRMVAQNEPGDERFFNDRIEAALRTYLEKKARKAARA